jgi:L-2,4-diaminobutyric acid acetyltransferase
MTQFQEAFTPQENFPHSRPEAPAILQPPRETDGAAIHNLIRRSAFLDDNSLYCYLLLCTHFAETSVVARINNEIAGAITAYVPPGQHDTLFVWQVAVAKTAQRRGLARQMLEDILQRGQLKHIRWIETTVTSDNEASRALFSSLARRHECNIEESVMFDRTTHFHKLHDTEHKLRIGPLRKG